jgi:polyisoprenoid-binding protein YceI
MFRPTAAAALLTATLFLAHAAGAAYGPVQPARSSLGFSYQQMGVPMNGRFARYTAQVSFDPARPAEGRATVDVDVASIDAGSPDATREATAPAWFDAKRFPTARFASTAVRALGGDRYEMAGRLTIKGRTKDVKVPVTFVASGGAGVLAGTLAIRRSEFAIGEGEWSAFDVVGDEVRITFRLTLSATPGGSAIAPATPFAQAPASGAARRGS